MVDKDTQETVFGTSVGEKASLPWRRDVPDPIGICEIQPDSSPHAQDTASTG